MNGVPLFSLQGRVNRKPLWMFLIVAAIIDAVMTFALTAAINGEDQSTILLYSIPVGLITLAISIVGLTFCVRRCHDRNRSGWFVLLMLVPLLNFWAFIEIYFLSGTPGPNLYGPDPLLPLGIAA